MFLQEPTLRPHLLRSGGPESPGGLIRGASCTRRDGGPRRFQPISRAENAVSGLHVHRLPVNFWREALAGAGGR